jgi:hypothetical protein
VTYPQKTLDEALYEKEARVIDKICLQLWLWRQHGAGKNEAEIRILNIEEILRGSIPRFNQTGSVIETDQGYRCGTRGQRYDPVHSENRGDQE